METLLHGASRLHHTAASQQPEVSAAAGTGPSIAARSTMPVGIAIRPGSPPPARRIATRSVPRGWLSRPKRFARLPRRSVWEGSPRPARAGLEQDVSRPGRPAQVRRQCAHDHGRDTRVVEDVVLDHHVGMWVARNGPSRVIRPYPDHVAAVDPRRSPPGSIVSRRRAADRSQWHL